MADFWGALRTRILAAPTVSAIVATRVYWNMAPQGAVRPYVVLTTISDPRPGHLQGYDGSRVTRVQCDCFGAKHIEATGLAEAILAACAGNPGVTGGVRFGRIKAEGPRDLSQDIEGIGTIHRASLDLLVEHAPA